MEWVESPARFFPPQDADFTGDMVSSSSFMVSLCGEFLPPITRTIPIKRLAGGASMHTHKVSSYSYRMSV
jgi:hypothetical protein